MKNHKMSASFSLRAYNASFQEILSQKRMKIHYREYCNIPHFQACFSRSYTQFLISFLISHMNCLLSLISTPKSFLTV